MIRLGRGGRGDSKDFSGKAFPLGEGSWGQWWAVEQNWKQGKEGCPWRGQMRAKDSPWLSRELLRGRQKCRDDDDDDDDREADSEAETDQEAAT